MPESISISLSGVHHSYQAQPVLHDISLAIPAGSIYGILGPSGCGKTTTVKIIAGLLNPLKGHVQVLDRPLPDLSVMNRIGYLAQSDALYGDLTGLENLRFFGQLYGLKGSALRQSIDRVLQLVHLQHELEMRQGRILASGSPLEIIDSCGAKDLEEAFLTLSKGGDTHES